MSKQTYVGAVEITINVPEDNRDSPQRSRGHKGRMNLGLASGRWRVARDADRSVRRTPNPEVQTPNPASLAWASVPDRWSAQGYWLSAFAGLSAMLSPPALPAPFPFPLRRGNTRAPLQWHQSARRKLAALAQLTYP